MTSLDSSHPQFPATIQRSHDSQEYQGLISLERRRRPLTLIFAGSVGLVLIGTGTRWPLHGIVRETLFFCGICLAAIGMLGRTWSNLFISGYKTRVLIKSGPYSMCRNPLYFFSAIGMVGIGLCSETLMIPVTMALFFAVYYPRIIDSEETRMTTHHEAFPDYCRQVPAFWPQIARYFEPDVYVIVPGVMRKSIIDAFWFAALAGLAHVISDLHETHMLPQFLELW